MPKGGPLNFKKKLQDVMPDAVDGSGKSSERDNTRIRKDFPESWIFDTIDGANIE